MTIPPTFFNANTPLIDTPFAQWQVEFQRNFQAMDETFSINHMSLESGANAGNHTITQLFQQSVGPITNISEFSIYSKDFEGQTTQLFMRYQRNGQEFQVTNYQIYPLPLVKLKDVILQEGYFSFLPGGIIVYFGMMTKAGMTSQKLLINPPIAKNICSINFTAISATNENVYPPSYELIQEGNYFTSLKLTFGNLKSGQSPTVPIYYTIMANI